MHEQCGVVGVIDLEGRQDVVPIAVAIAEREQHRGELGCGVAWLNGEADRDRIGVLKGGGLVRQVLAPSHLQMARAAGPAAIAHTRYATNASLRDCLVQPYHYQHQDPEQEFAFCFNGNEPDYAVQEEILRARGLLPRFEGDTEIIGQTIIAGMQDHLHEGMEEVLRTLGVFQGACNPVLLNGRGNLYATRDAKGFHPLVFARERSLVAIASEDSAIRDVLRGAEIRPIPPGGMLAIDAQSKSVELRQLWEPSRANCFFEQVYFADHRTIIDGVPVANSRYECGKILAEMDHDRPGKDIVVPVPESAKIAANGYADKRRLRRVDALLKNDEVGRTFTSARDRLEKARRKYDIDHDLLGDASVILVDDSLVRGTTMRALIEQMRNTPVGSLFSKVRTQVEQFLSAMSLLDAQTSARLLRARGAKEIHLRLASPPILHPCFYGIDFSTINELLVRKYFDGALDQSGTLPDDVLTALARDLGVDSIKYLPLSELSRAMGRPRDELCTACVTGKYPTEVGERLYQLQLRK